MLRIINEVSEMSHAMSPAEVTFYSDGLKIAGYLYSPDDWKPGDAPRRVREGTPKMVFHGDIMLRDPDSARQREMHKEAGHAFQNEERDLESAEATMRYRPD